MSPTKGSISEASLNFHIASAHAVIHIWQQEVGALTDTTREVRRDKRQSVSS